MIDASPRFPAWVPDAVFGAICLVAFGVLLTIGVEQWFFLDEWDFLADRTAWNLQDLLHPHNEHWSTIPILLYRGLFRTFGLTTYAPYRAMTVLSHLLCAVLMRAILRRLDVGPWLSIAVVLPWIFFGSGWQNIVWGFQVGWNLSLGLVMAQLLLADHPGPKGWRDALALVAGGLALMCAGIAPPLIAAVGLCLWLRHGWRTAALQVVPLGVVQAIWNQVFGNNLLVRRPTVDNLHFVWRGLTGTVEAYAWTGLAAAVLVAVVVAGTGLRWQRLERSARPMAFAVPLGFALGAAAYLLFVSLGRVSFGVGIALSSRYLHIISFLLLPLIGTSFAELVRRTSTVTRAVRFAAVGALVCLLWVGIPGNVSYFSNDFPARHIHIGNPPLIRAIATVMANDPDLPRYGRPSALTPEATIGWYQDVIANGDLEPLPSTELAPLEPIVRQSLQLVQVDQDFERTPTCEPLDDPIELDLQAGERLTFDALQVDAEVSSDAYPTYNRAFNTFHGDTLEALSPVHVVIANSFPDVAGDLCRVVNTPDGS